MFNKLNANKNILKLMSEEDNFFHSIGAIPLEDLNYKSIDALQSKQNASFYEEMLRKGVTDINDIVSMNRAYLKGEKHPTGLRVFDNQFARYHDDESTMMLGSDYEFLDTYKQRRLLRERNEGTFDKPKDFYKENNESYPMTKLTDFKKEKENFSEKNTFSNILNFTKKY